jgi:hypothetical protein
MKVKLKTLAGGVSVSTAAVEDLGTSGACQVHLMQTADWRPEARWIRDLLS